MIPAKRSKIPGLRRAGAGEFDARRVEAESAR